MKLLDRYLLKQFLEAFLFTLLTLTILITLIDYAERNELFLTHALAYGKVLDYYFHGYMPFVMHFITPISTFVAAVFVTSRLAQRTEIVAMLGSGISFWRFFTPYGVGAAIIMACHFLGVGWGLAQANSKRINFEAVHIDGGHDDRAHHLHRKIAPHRYLYIAHYDIHRQSGTDVMLETIEGNRLLERFYAKSMTWVPTKRQWEFKNWRKRTTIQGLAMDIVSGDTLNIALDIHPNEFLTHPNLCETLTLPELDAKISLLKTRGADGVHLFLIEKYVRYMMSCAVVILTWMGVVISARKTRRGIGFQIALGFILAFTYIACLFLARGVAEVKGTQLVLTVWLPNIIFATLGGIIYKWTVI